MDNIQLHPTRKIVVPNDRGTKLIFRASPERYHDRITGSATHSIIEMKKNSKFGEIKTPMEYSIDPAVVTEDPSVMEVLTRFDNDVANVCISEWEVGNRYVTYSTIYRTLTGRVGESDANPSKVQLAAIKHSLKKLMNVKLKIYFQDAAVKLGYNDGKKINVEDKIIPARFVDCTVNGQKTTVIELTAESPLLTVARMKNNQIISYDVELLNVPGQKNTPLNIELKHYAIRRVMETKAHPKQMTPSITFADVLEKCRIADADNKKKHRVRETLKAVFEHLTACGEIDSYEVNKKKGVFYSISFTFSKEKKAKQEPAKVVESNPANKAHSKRKEEPEKTEKPKEQGEKWQPKMTLGITPQVPWQYCPNTLEIMPWNTGINAFLSLLKLRPFLLF
ncbi:MAG: hypothetical protein IKN16_07120 [Selenomonadaceae bacterium]|nr:hypothetical protein [Selenomonadaceae bacterium]MBR6888203.1 hypothetical protein [Selenomonadaceae bacterium]